MAAFDNAMIAQLDDANILGQELKLVPASISLVDVGAAMFGEKQLYQSLLDRGLARLAGFEPDPIKFAEINRPQSHGSVVLNYALGDGEAHTLHFGPGGMTSLHEPDQNSYDLFSLFAAPPISPIKNSISQQPTQTTRLDDFTELGTIDLMKKLTFKVPN